EIRLVERQPRGHRVAAESRDQLRVARGDRIEHVADVDARHRTGRAAQGPVGGAREGDHRAADAILDAARDQTDDALVPVEIEEADALPCAAMACRANGAGLAERLN